MNSTARIRRKWTSKEDEVLQNEAEHQLSQGSLKDWNRIAAKLPGRTNKDCRKRWAKISIYRNKGAWDKAEDERLRQGIQQYGQRWTLVAQVVGTRHADQCAKRWQHSLDPSVDRSEWTPEEDRRLLAAVAEKGKCWKLIGQEVFPRRSTTTIKNRYAIISRRRCHVLNQFGLDLEGIQSPSDYGFSDSDGSDWDDEGDSSDWGNTNSSLKEALSKQTPTLAESSFLGLPSQTMAFDLDIDPSPPGTQSSTMDIQFYNPLADPDDCFDPTLPEFLLDPALIGTPGTQNEGIFEPATPMSIKSTSQLQSQTAPESSRFDASPSQIPGTPASSTTLILESVTPSALNGVLEILLSTKTKFKMKANH